MFSQSSRGLILVVLAAGCGSSSKGSPGSIAAMRAGASSDVTLNNVVSIAITPDGTLFAQDPGGGPRSAIQVLCLEHSTTHPCSLSSTVKTLQPGRSVTLTGHYVKAGAEQLYLTAITDNGPAALPAPAVLTLADIERGATSTEWWFQRVSVPLTDKLVLYDFSPAEYATGASSCSFQLGFGMIAAAEAAPAAAACVSSTAQPAGVTSPSPREVLFDEAFFHGFTVSSDCRCTATFHLAETQATSAIAAGQSVQGILLYFVPFGATAGIQSIAPQSAADAPIAPVTQR